MNGKEFFLMHKDIPLCLMEITDDGGIARIRRIPENAEHFPLGGQMNDIKFHEWWRDRAIPKTRNGAKSALQRLGYTSTENALVNNLALSLTDCYWIRPRGSEVSWQEINLFANDFVDTFGEITLNADYPIDLRNRTRFNCATSKGELRKKWCIADDGKRYMVKGNYGESYQQSLNEIFASRLHRQQNFKNYTEYYPVKLTVEGNREGLGCMCYDFCSENMEAIPAWELLQTRKLRQNESFFYPLKEVCLTLGMDEADFTEFIEYQILTDFLISNTDRHMNNIAVLRNPDTLQLLGFAPIFDSGNSMFYNLSYRELLTVHLDRIQTHSFLERESRLLQYVENRNCVDLEKAVMDFGLYEQDIAERGIRIPRLKEIYEKKLELAAAFQRGKDIWKSEKYAKNMV